MCTNYGNIFEDCEYRQFELKLRYGFDCQCELCSKSEDEQREIEEHRTKYQKLDEQIVEEGTLDPRKGIDLVKKALKIMEKGMPMFPKFVAKHAYEGFQFALACGNNLEEAQAFIQLAWRARCIELGESHPETQEMWKFMNNPKLHPLFK